MPWPGAPLHHQQQQPPPCPALFLFPLNDSFIPKQIALPHGQGRVKIGRQTNAKTVPGERNGYFDSKVLSRQHAEVWEENGKIFIKDVKSSNGTFINGERLSQEGFESDMFELKSDDIVEFGIDIVGEDNKTIIHHKVAAQVKCILTPDDFAQLPMHLPQQHMPQQLTNNQYPTQQQPRRPSIHQAASPGGLGGMGGGGPSMGLSGRSGKSGLTFDVILSRLQNELQKSRETGSELNTLSTVMTDINDTLGGGAGPPPPPHLPHALPPVRPPPDPSTSNAGPSVAALQSQLLQTQSSLASHVDKVKSLEGLIAEHEQIKREMQVMKDLMEQRKREMEGLLSANGFRAGHNPEDSHDKHTEDDDDDDARSVITVMPDDLDMRDHRDRDIPHENGYSDEERQREDDEHRARTEAMGRPRTPEPTGHGLDEDEDDSDRHHRNRHQDQPTFNSNSLMPPSKFSNGSYGAPHPSSNSPPINHAADLHSQNVLLSDRLETLTSQLDTALTISRTLQNQSAVAQSTIALLEAKVDALQVFVEQTKVQQQQNLEQRAREGEEGEGARIKMTELWDAWRSRVESEWKVEREEWVTERQRLKDAVKEWEGRMEELEHRERDRATREAELEAQQKVAELKRHQREIALDEDENWEQSETVGDDDAVDVPLAGPSVITNGDAHSRSSSTSKSPSKLRKRRPSASAAVATPPHSPTMNGDSSSLDHSSEGSGSRPPSPTSSNHKVSLFGNGNGVGHGHIKLGMLPLSPAPSMRHGENNRKGSEGGSSEADEVSSLAYANGSNGTSDAGELQHAADAVQKRALSKTMSENPLPYLSAAGVIVISLAAWAVVNRVKD